MYDRWRSFFAGVSQAKLLFPTSKMVARLGPSIREGLTTTETDVSIRISRAASSSLKHKYDASTLFRYRESSNEHLLWQCCQ